MKKIFILATSTLIVLSSCEGTGYGKYGRCSATTKAGSQCKSNAGKTGYCGTHK